MRMAKIRKTLVVYSSWQGSRLPSRWEQSARAFSDPCHINTIKSLPLVDEGDLIIRSLKLAAIEQIQSFCFDIEAESTFDQTLNTNCTLLDHRQP